MQLGYLPAGRARTKRSVQIQRPQCRSKSATHACVKKQQQKSTLHKQCILWWKHCNLGFSFIEFIRFPSNNLEHAHTSPQPMWVVVSSRLLCHYLGQDTPVSSLSWEPRVETRSEISVFSAQGPRFCQISDAQSSQATASISEEAFSLTFARMKTCEHRAVRYFLRCSPWAIKF